MSRKASFIRDQRGAVALEMVIVWGFLVLGLFLPLADLAIAGFQFISAREALRAFGQLIQYSPPPDVTNPSTWATAMVAKADPSYPIPSIEIVCGDTLTVPPPACSDATLTPKYYSYTTSVTLAPLTPLLNRLLCTSGAANPCTITIAYSERFQ
jgi:Flp pilus assembly protein TadG